MNQSFFIDSIENIALADGVVRMNCVVIEPGPENKPVGRRTASLAMPLAGFVRSAEQFNQVLGKLVEQGVLKKRDGAQPAAIEGKTDEATAPTRSGKK